MIEYFDWFSRFVKESHDCIYSVLEIGCNDGSQLNFFNTGGNEDIYDGRRDGILTFGIDPAENIHKISSKNHTVICDFLNADSISKVPEKVSIIYAQNVFAHNDNPLEFLQLCKTRMASDSKLFIQNSQSDMIINGEFDTIYHEHRSFFTHSSMKSLCDRAGLNIIDYVKGTIHGGSGIYVLSTHESKPARVENLLALEKASGLHDINTYKNWAANNEIVVNDLVTALNYESKNKGRMLVGYGAPAKGNTLLNYGKINLDFIIDDAPLKQGKFTPGMNIPVVPISHLDNFKHEDICFVPLAWNFFDEIVQRIRRVRGQRTGDKYIKYFPKIQVL